MYHRRSGPEICLAAVQDDGRTLQYVKTQTEEMRLAAALRFVKHQTEEICLEAVKKKSWLLSSVKIQTDAICIEAVRQDGMALRYVKTHEICLEAVKHIRDPKQKDRLFPVLHTTDESEDCPVCFNKCNTESKCHECYNMLIAKTCHCCRGKL